MDAQLWNEIPSSLRELPKESFKFRIKKKLLHEFVSVLENKDSFTEISRITSELKRQ